jgi:putative phosphoribosyl transferase
MTSQPDDRDERAVQIPTADAMLDGTLDIPPGATGIVLFAHGSGSSRFSPRNRYVARVLNDAGLGTLLIDLLTPSEEEVDDVTRTLRFDIAMLANRLIGALDWLAHERETHALPIGLFGASTGAGAALVAAAQRRDLVGAVVSRGGRPDLAGDALGVVEAPTLLVVGGRDDIVIALNERARAAMHAEVRIEIVPGATHLFEEAGTLERVASLARDWFLAHLRQPAAAARHS